jgi:hypothetical protein
MLKNVVLGKLIMFSFSRHNVDRKYDWKFQVFPTDISFFPMEYNKKRLNTGISEDVPRGKTDLYFHRA